MLAPETHDTVPTSLDAAKKELDALRKALFNFRRGHWLFIWGIGIIFFGIASCYFEGWRFWVLLTASVIFLVLTVLIWKGIINPAITRSSVNHVEEDRFLRRIAYLEGYVQSEEKKGPNQIF